MSPGQVLFGLSGRINRDKFWLYNLFWLVVLLVGLVAIRLTFGSESESFGVRLHVRRQLLARAQARDAAALLVIALSLPATISCVAIGLKRLHDRDKSAWWLLLFYVLPFFASDETLQQAAGNIGGAALHNFVVVVGFWGTIELAFLRGTAGPNRYGPDPSRSSGPCYPE